MERYLNFCMSKREKELKRKILAFYTILSTKSTPRNYTSSIYVIIPPGNRNRLQWNSPKRTSWPNNTWRCEKNKRWQRNQTSLLVNEETARLSIKKTGVAYGDIPTLNHPRMTFSFTSKDHDSLNCHHGRLNKNSMPNAKLNLPKKTSLVTTSTVWSTYIQ